MGGGSRKRRRKYDTPPEHGLYAKNYAKPVRWKVDYDYLDKLTDEERKWLSDFSDSHYGADFRSQHGQTWWPHERREVYVEKNAANRDVYGIGQVSGRVEFIPDLNKPSRSEEHTREFDPVANPKADFQPQPEYLNSEAYKAVVAEFRESLPPRGVTAKTVTTPRYRAAKQQLERVRRHGETEALFPRSVPARSGEPDAE